MPSALHGVATPKPRCQHQQQRGATGATRQAMAGGARKTTAALVYLGLLLLGRQVLRSRCRGAGGEASGGGAGRTCSGGKRGVMDR
eukprot:scaffold69282_cov55-Phaeocystis_antarctica.AAC.1